MVGTVEATAVDAPAVEIAGRLGPSHASVHGGGDPTWVRPAFWLLLAVTAGVYLWDLDAVGWANPFYTAAVHAGAGSWKAFFFGSFDSSNFITTDKPPLSLWVMGLSARAFGLSTWSILVPQVLEGVATVALVYATVRRWFSPAAGLLAGTVVALTPVAALMFRDTNPDALLTLLLTLAAYATTRALERGATHWLVLAGGCVGLGVLTKSLEALVVLPAIALVYLVAGPPRLGRRVAQLAACGLAAVAGAGWWIAAVALTPAADRPYVGGSSDNTVLNAMFGYNGLGRVTGNETGGRGALSAAAAAGHSGGAGLGRLLDAQFGAQASWLLPTALVMGVAVLWLTRSAGRTDRTRAAVLLWGGWLVVTGLVLSLSQGIVHPYYTVVLAPPIGALVGIGGTELWRRRHVFFARCALGVAAAGSAIWAFALLARTSAWLPWLRVSVLVAGLAAGVALFALAELGPRLRRTALGVALGAALAGPLAYTLATVASPSSGTLPTAGPASERTAAVFATGIPDTVTVPGPRVTAALRAGASRYRWAAAVLTGNTAAPYELASGEPVMAVGGFNGIDPAPSLARFEAVVAAGQVHYFLDHGRPGAASASAHATVSANSRAILAWVQAHFPATVVQGTTMYDLTRRR